MKLTHLFFQPDEKWQLVRQMGITDVIVKLTPELTGMPSIDDLESFRRSQEIYAQNGFKIIGLEGNQIEMIRIKLGLPGREQDIEKYQRMLDNMGKLGGELLCYNFMATGWYRTHKGLPERGWALVSCFNFEASQKEPVSKYGTFSESQIWENYHFYRANHSRGRSQWHKNGPAPRWPCPSRWKGPSVPRSLEHPPRSSPSGL